MTDELSDGTVFTKKYIKAKGTLLSKFKAIEWVAFVKELYKKAEYVEAQEVSDAVLTCKLFIDSLKTKPKTVVAADAYNILLDQDGFLYLRLGNIWA